MAPVKTLIPDNEGNHLVVVLNFYDDSDKTSTFQIPEEFARLDIADISIEKLHLDRPLRLKAFFAMCEWLKEQFGAHPDAVFFIHLFHRCSWHESPGLKVRAIPMETV